MSASMSARPERTGEAGNSEETLAPFLALPTETEIYILPDGRVIVADLPVELTPLTDALGSEPREVPTRP